MYWNPCSCSGWQRTQSQPSVSSFLASRFNFYLSGFNSEKHLTPGMFTTIFPPRGPWLSMLAVLQVASAMFPWYLASFLQVHDLECNFWYCWCSPTFVEHLLHRKLNILPLPGSQKNQLPVSVVQDFPTLHLLHVDPMPGLHCITKLPSLAPCHQQGWAHWMRGHICDC